MKCISIFKCKPQIEVIDKSHCNLEDVPNFQNYSRSLEELFLDANKLTLLNENVFRLTKLRRFSFSDNGVQDIPPDIAKLVNLVELDCSRNRIQIIPEQIRFLHGLQVCDFSGNDIEYLPNGLVQLKNLTLLTLNYCLIKDLPEDIGLLKNLESLELRENEIETLPASITGLESLKKLDLGRNLISKLPDDIGRLKNLEYLLLDANRLTTVPPKIGRLESLQCLDLSKQELGFRHLPEEISGLKSLTDLHLSENHLTSLPDGIGELRNLSILKADANILSDLNPNIGGCVSLQELVLTSNEINKLPTSIGNLIDLRSVNIDDNMMTELPHEIGNLKRLGILSLRDNVLTHLPNEIGQLESAKVIDLSCNRLEYLPISITALNLNALWLSKNQAQPLPKLQIDELPNGTRVLTCYLLPQQNESGFTKEQQLDDIGQDSGATNQPRPAAVSFDTAAIDDSENHLDDVNFVRHDTPHPRELRARHQKLFNGGQLQQNDQQHEDPNQLKGHDNEGFNINHVDNHQINSHNQPYDYGYESNGLPEIPIAMAPSNNNQHAFSDDYNNKQQHQTLTNNNNDISNDNGYNDGCYVIDFLVRRSKNHKPGLGLSIAGGKDTPPFKDNDEGIFVSKVTQGGPAEAAGVHVGDKILAVNDHQFHEGITHYEAVEVFRGLKSDYSEFRLRVLRDPNDEMSNNDNLDLHQEPQQQQQQYFHDIDATVQPKQQQKPISRPVSPPKPPKLTSSLSKSKDSPYSRNYTIPIQSESNVPSEKNNLSSRNPEKSSTKKLTEQSSRSSILDNSTNSNKNIIYTTLIKDYKRDLGIELENRTDDVDNYSQRSSGWSNIVIADILPDSVASQDGKLQVEDRLLSINGTDVTGIDIDRVKSMLNGTDRYIRIVVSRGDMNDPIGAALRNVQLKPTLGSWFSSTSNMTNRPSLIESYQRPTFGSVTNLQNNNNPIGGGAKPISSFSNSSSQPSSRLGSKPPKPPKPVHLLANDDELNSTSTHDDIESDRDLQSFDDSSVIKPTVRSRSEQREPSGTDDSHDAPPLSDLAKRAAWRKERLKSIDDDVEMAKIIAEVHRRRADDRN